MPTLGCCLASPGPWVYPTPAWPGPHPTPTSPRPPFSLPLALPPPGALQGRGPGDSYWSDSGDFYDLMEEKFAGADRLVEYYTQQRVFYRTETAPSSTSSTR